MTNKEEERLKKEPFETMIRVNEPEVLDELRGWKPPNHAYVLFKRRMYDVKEERVRWTLATLNVDTRPEQMPRIEFYVFKKGFKVIHWGNFPRADSNNIQHQQKVKLYSEGKGINKWALLEAQLQRIISFRSEDEFIRMQNELEAKKNEIARLNDMVTESKAKEVKKNESKSATATA